MLESPSPRSPAAGSRLSALVSRATPDPEEETVMTATLEPTTTVKAAKAPAASPADVIRKAHEAGVEVVDVRFCDLPGTWQHFSIPLKELSEDVFSEGLGFDGSSIRGFQAINESDMLLFPFFFSSRRRHTRSDRDWSSDVCSSD